MSNWITERNEQVKDLKNRAGDLEKKLIVATEALRKLSLGYYYEDDNVYGRQKLAANALKNITSMDQTPMPYIWWA